MDAEQRESQFEYQQQEMRRTNESFKENGMALATGLNSFSAGHHTTLPHNTGPNLGSANTNTLNSDAAVLASAMAAGNLTGSNIGFGPGSGLTNYGGNHLPSGDDGRESLNFHTMREMGANADNLNHSNPINGLMVSMNTMTSMNMNDLVPTSSPSNRKEMHRMVEKRRRDNINDGIQELANLVPGSNKNKILILRRVAEYIKQQQNTENMLREQKIKHENQYVFDHSNQLLLI